ncbi:low-density lipoprotein receptor class A domain-containing protein 2 [Anguilla anguilla]|uniref:low-density lipoprotein receptor class A domain-containing protein 2 n=1 Tax=Anguilla anguilla TaxID=7936 RepID=UPI0015A9AA12|nr:low-density lipoprotein receptor class A domain-containing protein 2 [Anguilla anguilla]
MASARNSLQKHSKLFVLLNFMTLTTNAIETVNLVDFCGQTIREDGMIVNSHRDSRKYYFVTMGTDCHLTMQAASPKDKVQFHFRFFLVYSLLRVSPLSPPLLSPTPLFPEAWRNLSLHHPTNGGVRPEPTPQGSWHEAGDPCHAGSFIQFYDGKDKAAPPLGPPLCGKTIPRPVLSTGNYLTLRLMTRGTQPRVDFMGHFTSFRLALGLNQSECRSEPYFTCENGKCIPVSLVCDDKGIDNCGDGSDQADRPPADCKGQYSTARTRHPRVTPPSSILNPPTLSRSTNSCGTPDKPDSASDSRDPVSLLGLYVLLGVLAGMLVLCWCCWSPGWFLWRVSVCRFLPCCNSACASCQLCTRSCSRPEEQLRPGKVTPQGTATATAMAV